MRATLFSLFFLSLTLFSNLHAQDRPYIQGPEVLCIEECGYFQVINGSNSPFWLVEYWEVYPDGASIWQIDSLSADICFFEQGTYEVYAYLFLEGTQEFDTLVYNVFVTESELYNIPLYSRTCTQSKPLQDSIYSCPFLACANSESIYYANSSGTWPIISENWNITGAVDYWIDGWDLHVIWGDAGIGTIYYEGFGQNGCQHFISETCIEILPEPMALFDAIPAFTNESVALCKGQALILDNLSSGGTYYEWSFGDGIQSDEFEPTHVYGQEGTYTITLRVYNQCDCYAEVSKEVVVLPAAAPELTCLATTCPEENQRYEALTDECGTFFWTISSNGLIVGGGGIDDDFIEVIWQSGPDGIIELEVDNCNQVYCDKPAIFRVPVVSDNGPIEGDQEVCSGEITTYSLPSFPGADYSWSVSSLGAIISGQNTSSISVKWQNVSSLQSNEWVHVDYDHCYLGCEGSDQIDVSITPQLFVSGSSETCENAISSFQATSGFFSQTPIQANWRLENIDGMEVWNSAGSASDVIINMNFPPGEYSVIATAVDPSTVCEPEFSISTRILPLPTAPLGINGPERICIGNEYAFSVNASGNYETNWIIYDGTDLINKTGSVVTHQFNNAPPYSVEIWHTSLINSNCQSASITQAFISTAQNSIYGENEVCEETFVTYFTEEIESEIIEWEISPADIADIKIDNNNQATFFWNYPGNAMITMNACGTSIIKNISVNPKPTPNVSFPEFICENELAQVSTSELFADYQWKDETGTLISSDPMPMLTQGYYSLEVTNSMGCQNEGTFQIKSYPKPTAFITTPGDKAFCNAVPPTPLVANTDGINYHFKWYKNGVEIASSDNPTLLVDTFGTYQVEVINQFGCTAFSNNITIFNYCGPRGGVCNGQTCSYPCAYPDTSLASVTKLDCNTHRFSDISGNIIPGTLLWEIENPEFNNYYQFTDEPLDYTFENAGYYTIILIGKLNGFVYPQPNCFHYHAFIDTVAVAANFRNDIACEGALVSFEDLSTFLPDYGISNWDWDFGDPASGASNNSTDQHPMHIYSQPGIYQVQLSITSTSGCTSTFVKTIEVIAQPTIIVSSADEACENSLLEMNVQDNLFYFDWNFDDPSSGINDTASSQYVSHNYAAAGSYNPSVSAEDIYGCRNDTSINITIFTNTLAGDITSSNGNPICEGDSTILNAPGGGTSWLWSTSETTENIQVKETGRYDLIIRDDHGCTYAPDPILLLENPKPALIIQGRETYEAGEYSAWSDTLEVCEGIDLEIKGFTNGNVDYLWSTGATTPSLFFTDEAATRLAPGDYNFSLQVTDKNTSCISDLVEFTIIVHASPVNFTISSISGNSCEGTPNMLQIDMPEAGVIYTWSDGQVGDQITTEEAGNFMVTATSPFGCTSTSWNSIIINDAPEAFRIPSGCYIECNPHPVCLPTLTGVADYIIYKDGSVWNQGTGSPDEFVITESGSYEIELTGINGCESVSAPLNLDLYDGVGHIFIPVYYDVNENGQIDAGDNLIQGIEVALFQNLLEINRKISGANGMAQFFDLPQGNYHLEIDTFLLPDSLFPIIYSSDIEIVGCDSIFSDSFLLGSACNTVIAVIADTTICPGESLVISDTTIDQAGTYIRHFTTTDGCDSTITYNVTEEWRGSILATVYLDLNLNGIVDAGDSVMVDIDVWADHVGGAPPRMGTTGANGAYLFENLPHPFYIVSFDYNNPPDPWIPLIDQVGVDKLACDTIEVDLLLGPDTTGLLRYFDLEICAGDSAMIGNEYYSSSGTYVVILPGPIFDTVEQYNLTVRPEIQYTVSGIDACSGSADGSISLEFTGTNNYTINWNHTSSNDSVQTDLGPGIYTFTISDSSCMVSGEVEIIDVSFPTLSITPVEPLCPNGEDGLIIIDDPAGQLSWSFDNLNYSSGDSISNLSSGTYTTYISYLHCTDVFEITVDEPVYELIQLPQNVTLPMNVPYDISHNYTDSLKYTFNWSPPGYLDCSDCPMPTFAGAEENVLLSVIVTDLNGCIQEQGVQVLIEDRDVVYIPNAFSPNNDAVNDHFLPYTDKDAASPLSMMIFNRWGDKLYEEFRGANNPEIKGWDGRQSGDFVMPGVYIYAIEIEYSNGKKETKYGDLTLIR